MHAVDLPLLILTKLLLRMSVFKYGNGTSLQNGCSDSITSAKLFPVNIIIQLSNLVLVFFHLMQQCLQTVLEIYPVSFSASIFHLSIQDCSPLSYTTIHCSFNDRIRDSVNGGNPFGNPLQQGFSTGLFLEVILMPFILLTVLEMTIST